MGMSLPIIAVVTRETRLEGLKARWATAQAAVFRLQLAVDHEVELRKKRAKVAARGAGRAYESDVLAAGALAEEDEYEAENDVYQRTVHELLTELEFGYPIKRIDRTFLPNFDFGRCVAVVVIGPDGLV